MNRFVPNRKCVVFCLLLLALGVVVALGWAKTEVPIRDIPEIVKFQQRSRAAGEDRDALEAYEKRDGKIVTWVENAAIPNPGNAALLYYQAFLLRPETNMDMTAKLNAVLRGAESDRQVRTYLGHCLPMIHVAEIASRMPRCTWGIWQGAGPRFDGSNLFSEVINLKNILVVDASTLAADEHYRAALERCLTLRRVARHLSDSQASEVAIISWGFNQRALMAAQHVLGVMPPDAETLSWFRGQLALVQGVTLSLAEVLHVNLESFLNSLRTDPTYPTRLRNRLAELTEDEETKKILRNLTDEQLFWRAREPFLPFFASIFRIADSEMTYEQKRAQLQGLVKKMREGDGTDPVVAYVMAASGTDPVYEGNYPLQVRHSAHINGIKAAVEVYLVMAKTGQLPEKLPRQLPKDPYTGLDFGYEITDEGFALRCQGKDFQGRRKMILEFKVRK